MSNTIYLSVAAIFYTLMVLVLFISKKKIVTVENKIYSKLLFIMLGSLISEVSITFIKKDINYIPFVLSLKIYLVFLLIWLSMFSEYVFMITHRKSNDINRSLSMYKKVRMVYTLINLIVLFLIFTMPIYFYDDGATKYSYGPSVDLMFTLSVIYSLFMTFLTLKNIKKISKKEILPIFLLLVMLMVSSIIQNNYRGILLVNFVFSFITVLLYHTIENPDVQMMEELYKNKKLIEKSSEDTSNFLFRMTQDIKKPIKDIIDVSADMFEIKDVSELMEGTKIINNKARELDYLVNDALDVSRMNTDTIKIYDTRYNALNLFNEIRYQIQNKLDDNVKFEYSISNNLPLYLYGDSIKLKQVIYSILDNSISNTTSGYISLNISSIIKYDICRLIINIFDSGKGMNIEEVNNILSLNIDDLSKIDISNDKKNYNLKEIKKLVTFLGGNLIVKSGEGKGTEVSITIDQKIVKTKDNEISKKLDLYEQSIQSGKKIMVVDDDAKELSKITTYLEGRDVSVSGSLFGRDVINKISSKHKFDLIILDDETDTASAYEVLMELKKNPKFNIPVVIMIDDNKEFIKLHFLKDGFADVIMKSKLNSELDRILKRF